MKRPGKAQQSAPAAPYISTSRVIEFSKRKICLCWWGEKLGKDVKMYEMQKSINFFGKEKFWQGGKMCAGGATSSL